MRNITILTLAFASIFSFAQQKECVTEEVMKRYLNENPEAKQRIDSFNLEISNLIKSGKFSSKYSLDKKDVIEIPIVVHVVGDGSPIGSNNNKSDEQIIEWINYSNEVLAGTSAGMLNDSNGGAAIPIKLVFAKVAPNCQPTNGINRIDASHIPAYVNYGANSNTGFNGVHENDILALGRWDQTKYYNIYVVNKLYSGTVAANGYAYYPSFNDNKDHSFMATNAATVGSQTMPHEFGHALGLRHTHEGYNGTPNLACPPNNDCTLEGDLVCDTEPLISLYDSTVINSGCLTGSINQCTGELYAGGEQNVMSYTRCFRNRFTAGQRERALAHLYEFRQNLIESNVAKDPIINTITPALKAVCKPTSISNPGNFNIGITQVQYGDINNHSQNYILSKNNFYTDYTTNNYCLAPIVTNIKLNTPTTIKIKSGSRNTHFIKAYIDFNNDGVFDESTEKIVEQGGVAANTTIEKSILPPSTTTLNTPLRLRVIGDNLNISACDNLKYGETEDYAIIVYNELLNTNDFSKNQKITITSTNGSIKVLANQDIESVMITDFNGRIINNNTLVKSKTFEKFIGKTNQIMIITVKLTNGESKSQKIRL